MSREMGWLEANVVRSSAFQDIRGWHVVKLGFGRWGESWLKTNRPHLGQAVAHALGQVQVAGLVDDVETAQKRTEQWEAQSVMVCTKAGPGRRPRAGCSSEVLTSFNAGRGQRGGGSTTGQAGHGMPGGQARAGSG